MWTLGHWVDQFSSITEIHTSDLVVLCDTHNFFRKNLQYRADHMKHCKTISRKASKWAEYRVETSGELWIESYEAFKKNTKQPGMKKNKSYSRGDKCKCCCIIWRPWFWLRQNMCFWIEIRAGTDCTRLKDNVASKKKSPRGSDAKVVNWCVLMSSPFPGSNSSHWLVD